MNTVYAVGLIYNDEWEGEVIQIYSLWSEYNKAKEEALKEQVRYYSAIVVQPFKIDDPNFIGKPEIIKSHEGFVRYGT